MEGHETWYRWTCVRCGKQVEFNDNNGLDQHYCVVTLGLRFATIQRGHLLDRMNGGIGEVYEQLCCSDCASKLLAVFNHPGEQQIVEKAEDY